MKSTIFASLITLASASGFQVLIGSTNDPVGGGTGQNIWLAKPDAELSCDNLGEHTLILKDDASNGGAACDGCDENNPNDYEVTRFELYDGDFLNGRRRITEKGFGTLTAYLTEGDTYNLVARDPDDDDSQRSVGYCERRKGDSEQCPRGLTTDYWQPFMECFGEDEDISLKEG